MTGFVQHLESLTSSAIQSSADEKRILEDWARSVPIRQIGSRSDAYNGFGSYKGHQEGKRIHHYVYSYTSHCVTLGVKISEHSTPEDVNEEDPWASVLDVFRSQKFTPPIRSDTIISRLLSCVHVY